MLTRLDTLSEGELLALAKQTKNKKFLILTHPTCERAYAPFEEHLKTENQNTVTIILETPGSIRRIKETIPKVLTSKGIFLYVLTPNSGHPEPSCGWQKLIRRLEILGARNGTITVGGRLLKSINYWGAKHMVRLKKEELQTINPPKDAKEKNAGNLKRRTASDHRAIQRALHMRGKSEGEYYGCAGVTRAKLESSGKFNVRKTRKFT